MNVIEYLKNYKEEMPEWLFNYSEGYKLKFAEVIDGRTAYYPGCGDDGLNPLKGGMHNYDRFLYAYPSGFEGIKHI